MRGGTVICRRNNKIRGGRKGVLTMFILSFPLQIAFLFSVLFCITDMLERKVPAGIFAAYLLAGVISAVLLHREIGELVLCTVPGLLFLAFSVCLGKQVGAGDGLYLLLTSLFVSFGQMLLLLAVSLLSAAAVSLIMIINGNKRTIPFLSFMPLPFILMLMEERAGK